MSVIVLSLVWSVAACGRLGYDLLPIDDGPHGDGGSSGAGTSGASGASGAGGSAGAIDPVGQGGAGIEADGGGIGGDAAGGAGGSAGSAAGGGGAGGSTALPLCTDGSRNGDELGIDCGGAACLPCACTFGAPTALGNPNYPGNLLWKPSPSADALSMYVAVVVPGVSEQIVFTTRPDRGDTFDYALPLAAPVNQSVEGTPHIALDGLSLYFFSERAGGRDLYVATRSSANGTFNTAAPLSPVNSPSLDHLPWTSGDELTLYFASQRSGNMDIWRATRGSRAEPFGAPLPVTELDTSDEENGMALTPDERTIIFASTRPSSIGDYDLYQAMRAGRDEPFATPEPLTVLNSSALDTDPALTSDGQELFFISTRNGATEVWRSLRTCP